MNHSLTPAGLRVQAWLEQQKKSRAWLAARLGVSRPVLWRWLVGASAPRVQSAAAVEILTGIAAAAWAANAPPRRRVRRRR